MGDTRYSVRRAQTEDERARRVERVGVVIPLPIAGEPRVREEVVRWQVEIAGDRVCLRHDGVTVELPLGDARRIADTILRRG